MTPARVEWFLQLLEFADDCASYEGYAHALPQEVVVRARRLVKMEPREVVAPPHEPEPLAQL